MADLKRYDIILLRYRNWYIVEMYLDIEVWQD